MPEPRIDFVFQSHQKPESVFKRIHLSQGDRPSA